MDTGIRTKLYAFRVHSQQRDVVVVRSRTVSLVFDHSKHFQVDVFRVIGIAAVMFQESYTDVFPFESVYFETVSIK